MTWRYVAYPIAAFAGLEGVLLAGGALWHQIMGSVPDSTFMGFAAFIIGIASIAGGACCGIEAVEQAQARYNEDEERRRDDQKHDRQQREKYMERFGVAPDPENVVKIKTT